MALQFITGGSGSGKTEYLCNYVCEASIKEPHGNFIFVVPEQYTMATQKKLVTSHSRQGILNIDVVSFERLAYKVFEEVGGENKTVLDDTGKNFIVRRVLEQHKDELVYFGSGINKTGFVSELKSVISELLQYGITVSQLEELAGQVTEKQQLHAKLTDIDLIYQYFMEYLRGHYITSEEILDVLCGVIHKSAMIRNSVLVFDGFTGFTPVQYKLLHELLILSRGIKLSVTLDNTGKKSRGGSTLFFMSQDMMTKMGKMCDLEQILVEQPVRLGEKENFRFAGHSDLAFLEKNLFRYNGKRYEQTPENMQIYEGATPKEELQYAVAEILKLTRRDGYSYKDIAIVTADLETYGNVAANLLAQNDIPNFLDYKRSVTDNPFIALMNSALEIIEKRYTYDAMFRYLRTGMTGISTQEIDLLENYCLAVGIRGAKAWHEPFTKKMRSRANGDLKQLNELRVKIIQPFLPFEEALRQKGNVRSYVTALYEFLVRLDCEHTLQQLSKDSLTGNEYEQLYAKVMQLFDNLVTLLGEESVSVKEFARILIAGFDEIKVGLLPPTADCVVVGDIERTRLDNIKVLFFVGVNDSVVPKKAENTSVLSEIDRDTLAGMEVVLSPSVREKAFIQRFYLYLILTKASEKLYISYTKKDSGGRTLLPSYLIRNLKMLFPYVPMHAGEEGMERVRYLKIPKAEIAWSEENYIRTLAENAAVALYGDFVQGSISAFENFASCRFAYFLQYGLHLSEREEFQFAVNDFGTILHSVLECVEKQLQEEKRSVSLLTPEERRQLVMDSITRIAEEYGNTILKDSSRNQYMVQRMADLAERTLWAVGKQLERGVFAPDAYELKFVTEQKDLPGGKHTSMRGKIDRVDICEDEEHVYVRIIDYKTGKSDFDLLKSYYGLKMQLVTYMHAAREIEQKRHPGKQILPAGMLYYNIDNPIIDISDMDSKDEAAFQAAVDEKILEALKMKGVVNESPDIIRKMDDRGGKSAVIPVSFKTDGNLDSRSHIYSTQQFLDLEDYIARKSVEMAKDIFAGDIAVNPYTDGKMQSCTYCPYHAVCGFSPDISGNHYRVLRKFTDEEIWKKIREGGTDDGKSVDTTAADRD